jgi:hypothetical protein
MQLQMKEIFREFAYPKTTSILPPPREVKTKGANKRTHLSQRERSTRHDPSFFEHMERRHQSTPRSSSQKSARKSNQSPAPRLTPPPRPAPTPSARKWHPDVQQLPLFMPDYDTNTYYRSPWPKPRNTLGLKGCSTPYATDYTSTDSRKMAQTKQRHNQIN